MSNVCSIQYTEVSLYFLVNLRRAKLNVFLLQKEGAGPLPPLSDSPYPHDIFTRRAMVKAYNLLLERFCASNGIHFVNINRHLIVSDNLAEPERVNPVFSVFLSTSSLIPHLTLISQLTEWIPPTFIWFGKGQSHSGVARLTCFVQLTSVPMKDG